ncbi:MAG: insulinase family protein [Candidatus Riflebacteria bacterium]|nr:insulinase family protein [Candidatus Riflebacteria bacterium]
MAISRIKNYDWKPLIVEKLDNGITVIVKEDHVYPLAVSDVWFRVGSRNEDEKNNGIAHFLEHILFKGTTSRGPGQIAREIECFGGRTNAGTSNDFTHYYISCESRHIEKAIEIHADVFKNSLLDQKAIDEERTVILEEIKRSDDNPSSRIFETLFSSAFPGHPYSRRTLGTRVNIDSGIKRDDIVSFFQKWYTPSNMYIIVSGDVDSKRIIEYLRGLYSDFNRQGFLLPDQKFSGCFTPEIIRNRMDVNKDYMLMAFPTVPASNWQESLMLDLFGVIMGQGRSSRLSMELRERRNIVTSVGAGQISMLDAGLFLVKTEFDSANEKAVSECINKQLSTILNDGVNIDELNKAKEYLAGIYWKSIETCEGKAETLGSACVKNFLEREFDYLERIWAVSAESVLEVVRKYINTEKSLISLVSPASSMKTSSLKENVGKYDFSNGTRIVHRQVKGTGLVGICISVDAGSRNEAPGFSGLANYTAEMLVKGTKNRDGQKILWELENLGAGFSPVVEPDLVKFICTVPESSFSDTFELFFDIIQNPSFSDECFGKEKIKILTQLKSVADNSFENTWRILNKALYGVHPYSHYQLGESSDVENINVESLKNFHRSYFTPSSTVIGLTGDISSSAAIDITDKFFGLLKRSPRLSKDSICKVPQDFPVREKFERYYDRKDRGQTVLAIGWHGARFSDPDYWQLKVLSTILGAGMSSRLFDVVRNKKGLAYSISCVFPTRIDKGIFAIIAGTDPRTENQVVEAAMNEIKFIQNGEISDEEIERAKNFINGQFLLSHGSTSGLAQYLAWFELIGAGFEFDRNFSENIRKVTKTQIQEAAAKYLNPQRAALAVTGPALP